jgi:hypothetical protein
MKIRTFAPAVVSILLGGVLVAPVANAAGRPPCLVSNEQTGLGSTSLQNALDAAASGDTLIVKGTCVGSSTIDKSLTLKGVSNKPFGQATLNGGGAGRVLFVDFFDPERRGFNLTIENLMITHGFGEDGNGGGGLLVQGGTVFIRNSIVTGNSAGRLGGGGIQVDGGAMTLTGTTVSNNAAGDVGGGILGGGTLTIEASSVTGNTVAGIGGGLFFSGGILTVTNSTVSRNLANGGAGIFNYAGTVTLASSTVIGNRATFSGGGISNSGQSPTRSGTMTIEASLVIGNVSGSSGGGIENRGDMTLLGSTVSGNSGVNCGGGISNHHGTLDILDSSVSGNTAVCAGGVANSNAAMTITDSTVSGNSATVNGGGLLNAPNLFDSPSTMMVSGSTVQGNTAANGGGIMNFGTLTFASPSTTVGGNSATIGGGVLHVESIPVRGSITDGCPTALGGNVLYSPANTPTDYVGFTCLMPVPQLATNGTEDYVDAFGDPYTRYRLTITNWAAYSPELFAAAPDLPPCGLNTNASRTWVSIHRASDSSYIYGFCGLSTPSDLTQIWFAVPRGNAPPLGVYVTLTDRRTGQVVTSNVVGFKP